jgi:hypothetical protein
MDDAAAARRQQSRGKRNGTGTHGSGGAKSRNQHGRASLSSTGDVTMPIDVAIGAALKSPSAPAAATSPVVEHRMTSSPTELINDKLGSGVDFASLITPTALVLDVVCGLNRAKLYVNGLRNGSKTPCVYMEAAAGDDHPGNVRFVVMTTEKR